MIRKITDATEKQRISRSVLEALEDWFANPEAREAYIRGSGDQVFLAAFEDDRPVGFLCLSETGRQTAEIAVMGIQRPYHRLGIGTELVREAERAAREEGYRFLQVKTVRFGMYPDYDATNLFYRSLGFCELEVFPEHWGPENPCQVYIKSLGNAQDVLEVIRQRRSYRGRYLPVPVPREDLLRIVEAGLSAPSGCNKQTASLIAVDDPAVLAQLRAVIDPPVGETAPALICVLTQKIVAYRDRCFAVQDYAAAIENMLLAAEALGYKSCWYEGHITDLDRIGARMATVLHVPEDYELVCFLPVGIGISEAKEPPKKPLAERAWLNGFRSPDGWETRKNREG